MVTVCLVRMDTIGYKYKEVNLTLASLFANQCVLKCLNKNESTVQSILMRTRLFFWKQIITSFVPERKTLALPCLFRL